MNERQFRDVMDTCERKSGNDLKDYLSQFRDQPIVVSLLTGTEFDDIGIARTSGRKAALEAFPDLEDDAGTLTESLIQYDQPNEDGHDIDQLYLDVEMLDSKSGDDQKAFLTEMFEDYAYPSVVSYAVLSDQSLGFGESTLAKAFDVKDSLPFYESVVDITRDDDPITSPVAGRPFKPMLAKSESSLPDDLSGWWGQPKLDGYRILIHINQEGVSAFTRRMNDVSESLPELQEINWPDGEYILDAEVIAEDGTYKSTSSRVGRSAENVEREVEMEFGLFDSIIYNGENVSQDKYKHRYDDCKEVERKINDLRVYTLTTYDNEEEARTVGRDHEGLIWKDPDAPYKFDKRSKAWVKEKNTAETVDVIAAAFEEGEGRLDGTLGKVVLESADGVEVGRTGSGFSDDQRDEVWQNQGDYLREPLEVEAEAFDDGLRFPIFQRWRVDDGEPDNIERIKELLPAP